MWETQHNNADLDCCKTWFCRRPWRFKINIRENSVHFRKSHVCANKLDVQETDFSFTQFYKSWNHFWQDCYGKGNLRKSYCSTVGRRLPIGNAYSYAVKKDYSYLCMWMTLNWLERNKILILCGMYSTRKLVWENQHLSLIMKIWCVLKDKVKQAKILLTITEPCLNPEFLQEQLRNFHARKIWVSLRGLVTWKVMPRNGWKDIVSWRTKRLNNSTKYQFHALMTTTFKEEELKCVGELSKVCSQVVLKGLYLARIGRPDNLWSVNKLARSSTKWTKACDKRLFRMISYFHHTNDYKQYCHVGNSAKQCRLGLFQDSDFAGDLEDSKSTSGGTLCIFGSHTFVPISWMCKKQISDSHSSTESEIISLGAGLRMDGIPALDVWDLVVAVLHGKTHQNNQVRWDPHKLPTRKKIHGKIDDLNNVDFFPQKRIILVRKPCCTSLKTTKQWSRWS